MKKKQQKNNLNKVSYRKVNLEKTDDIAVQKLDIFHKTTLKQHLTQNIIGHLKYKHKMYVLIHRMLNHNL